MTMAKQEPIEMLVERVKCMEGLIVKYKGYMIMLRKARGKSSEPADIDLLDFKGKVNYKILIIVGMIDRRLHSFNVKDL